MPRLQWRQTNAASNKSIDGGREVSQACIECGMICEAAEYHPYAACLMFKACHNSTIVTANLDGVRAHAAQYDSGFDNLADKNAELKECLRLAMDQIGTSSKLYKRCESAITKSNPEAGEK
jgi:hypothetical protein